MFFKCYIFTPCSVFAKSGDHFCVTEIQFRFFNSWSNLEDVPSNKLQCQLALVVEFNYCDRWDELLQNEPRVSFGVVSRMNLSQYS